MRLLHCLRNPVNDRLCFRSHHAGNEAILEIIERFGGYSGRSKFLCDSSYVPPLIAGKFQLIFSWLA